MATPLFREEAIVHQQDRSMGDVLSVHSTISLVPVMVLLILTCGLIGYLLLGEYHRKSQAQGYLVPSKGMVKVVTRRRGTVIEKNIEEGSTVQAGDVLFILSAEQSSLEKGAAQSEIIEQLHRRIVSLQSEQQQLLKWNQLKLQEMQGQRENLIGELDSLAQVIQVLRDRIDGAEKTLQRYRQLSHKKFVSDLQQQEKNDQLLALQGALEVRKSERLKSLSELNRLDSALQTQPIEYQQQHSRMDREIAELKQEMTEYELQRSIVVRAPISGIATAVLVEPGQQAEPMQTLVSVIPAHSRLEAHLFVPSRAIGFVEPGKPVELRYQSFPYQRFGNHSGEVITVAKAMTTAVEARLPFPLPESSYRVVVALDKQSIDAYGKILPLQAGMLLDADILLERRRIYQWLLDPLYSLARR